VQRLQKWEDELVQNRAQSNDDIINFINKLSADYIFLRGEMDANIPFVTDGQKQQYEVLHTQWQKWQGEMQSIIDKDVDAFNKLFADKKLPRIAVPQ
jgi:hypothetical protein